MSASRIIVTLALCAAACGPIEYVNQVTRKASSDLEAAKSVQADKLAPYYYTLAVEYLKQARVEASYADYQAANRFGRRSSEAARRAKEEALDRAKNPEKYELPAVEGGIGEDVAPLGDDDDEGIAPLGGEGEE